MALPSIKVNLSAFEGREDGKTRAAAIDTHSIAIVGMGLRLPQADTPQQFAQLLRDGRDAVRPIPASRKRDADRYLRSLGKASTEIRYGEAAYLEAIDKFDYAFFKLSPKEASLLDPNQRLFLQAAWHALEDAGYAGDKLRGSRTGVYLGYGSDADYKRMISEVDPASAPLSMPGNVRPIIASRLSYLLDLKGPSLAVDTTCSSSLVAVHLACQALRSGECDTAVVGGIQLHLVPVREFEVGVESSTSRTRTFDFDADGTGTGEGAVAVVLKPLHKAVEERDAIYAVIKGSAINQDGSSAGITAPNAAAQTAVLEEAWRRAGVAPDTIRYIETHGTGTRLGDPIEAEGLQQAFRRHTTKRQFCAVGSVKSNLGHLDNAAGIAGLVKAALSLQQQVLFPTLHFSRPNPNIDFIDSPIYVNQRLLPWEADEHPRRCGVSSFGISGTNCHVVLEEAPASEAGAAKDWPAGDRDQAGAVRAEPDPRNEHPAPRPELFVLSALSEDVLRKLAARMLAWIRRHSSFSLADLCYTLATGRGHYDSRLAFVAESREQLIQQLESYLGQSAVHKQRGMDEDSAACRRQDRQSGPEALPTGHRLDESADSTSEAARIVDAFMASGKRDHVGLYELARLYRAGAALRWEKLYQREKRHRLHLPVYPFSEKRCWLRFPDTAGSSKPAMLHRPVWTEMELPGTNRLAAGEHYMLIKGRGGGGEELADLLRGSGHAVHEYDWDELLAGGASSLRQLWEAIRDKRISRIVHLGCWRRRTAGQDDASRTEQLQRGLYGLQAWFKAMPDENIAQAIGRQIELCLVADYAQAVTAGQAQIIPPHAAMFGFAKAIHWELPSIRVRTVDTDPVTDADQLVRELTGGSTVYHAAYREGIRYEAQVETFVPDASADGAYAWRTDGLYLITGGLGGIGLALAKHMATQAPVKLALLSRSGMSRRQLAQVEALEELGAQVICCQADVANEAQMLKLVAELRQAYGPIRGVVHAAGISAGNRLTRLAEAELQAVMRAKEQGTLVLERAVGEDEPDFFALCSSAITLVGGVGSGPYTAANAYLDAFAAQRNARGKRTLAINWPAWDHTGLSEGAAIEEEKELFRLLPPDEAAACFELALRSQAPQLYVGEWNRDCALFRLGDLLPFRLSAGLEQWLQAAEQTTAPRAASVQPVPSVTEQVQLRGGADDSYSEIELRVANAWRGVLGYDELDIHANFFEIGGDSILITNVHAQLEEQFPGSLKVADLFSHPTIAKLSAFLREQQSKEAAGTNPQRADKEPHTARRQRLRSLLRQLTQHELTVDQAVAHYREMEVGI